jgi:hypothetical protein
MCYMFYLGSDVPLPTSEWQEESPAFYLSSGDEEIKEVKRHFTKPEVYYAGSHEGCGCGFFFDKNDNPEDYEIRKSSVRGLVEMLQQALESSSSAELFVTWAGCEKQAPSRRMNMKPEDLLVEEFPLDEKDFVIFSRSVEQAD